MKTPIVIFDRAAWNGEILTIEGDCACPLSFSAPAENKSLPTADALLQQTPVSHSFQIGEFTAVASSHSRASLVLLNDASREIWRRFETPFSLQNFSAEPFDGASEFSAVTDLHRAGFLHDALQEKTDLAVEDTLVAWLHVTNACNLRCTYCYLNKTTEKMDLETGRFALGAIFRSAKSNGLGKIKLKYAGGEPTMNMPLVLQLHDEALEKGEDLGVDVRGVILSNGALLNEKMIRQMQRRNLKLMISLDGVGEMHDRQRMTANGKPSFEKIAENIEMTVAEGLIPDICVTVSGQSAERLPETVEWLLEKDLPFSLNFYRENAASQTHAELKLEETKIISGMKAAFKIIENNLPNRSLLASLADRGNLAAPHATPCAADNNYLVIDHFGGVSKCQMEMDRRVSDVRSDDPLTAVRADQDGVQNLSVDEKEGCRDCEWKYWCTGGCPKETYRATGRYDVQSPNCNIYKAIYPEILRLEALRLLKNYELSLS